MKEIIELLKRNWTFVVMVGRYTDYNEDEDNIHLYLSDPSKANQGTPSERLYACCKSEWTREMVNHDNIVDIAEHMSQVMLHVHGLHRVDLPNVEIDMFDADTDFANEAEGQEDD